MADARIGQGTEDKSWSAGIDHELGIYQMGGGRALQQYTSTQKRAPPFAAGQISSQWVDFSCQPQPESGGTGAGASIFGTARNKALTLRPVPIAV